MALVVIWWVDMTRFLSQALGAREPTFSQSISALEHAAGRPNADIHLTTEVTQRMRAKISALGLDPNDTTGPELYSALHERLKQDEANVRRALGITSGATGEDVIQSVQKFLTKHDMPKQCFALKTSVAKRLLKKKLPKIAMKQLGYRSADSMLKHEPVAALYAAAMITEPVAWQKSFREQYAKLTPSDFETRAIALVAPKTKRWHTLSRQVVEQAKHNLLSFPELGALVALPIEHDFDGLAITTLLLMLEEMNGIRAHSSYAKLQQVKPDFGSIMQESSVSEPYTTAQLAGQPVPWRMIQRYYSRFADAYHPEIFEPHVQLEDLAWYGGEQALAALEPSLAFWQDTQCLGLIHDDGTIVSCNVLDVALSYCNHLPFAERVVHFVRDNLWHELMMRYLNQENLEAAVHRQLSAELEQPLALAEEAVYNEA
ncbi:MAG TPA: hypothetical protein VJP80_04620 [Candidatus Saccharimonadales bacterium]|nr:hypothetical protein [Candidatus Saccharimonadales bacterium]